MGNRQLLKQARQKRDERTKKSTAKLAESGTTSSAAPMRTWLYSNLLGLVLASLLIFAVNVIVNYLGPDRTDPFFPLIPISTPGLGAGEALGAIAILATVVVALAFSRQDNDADGQPSGEEALVRRRLSSFAFLVGATALAVSFIQAAGSVSATPAEVSKVDALMTSVFGMLAAQATAFAAAHTQPRPGDLVLAATTEFPELRRRHLDILLDLRLRWGMHARYHRSKLQVARAVSMALAIPVLLVLLILFLAALLYSDEEAGFDLILSLTTLSVSLAGLFVMFTILASITRQLWPTPFISALAMSIIAAGSALTLVAALMDPHRTGLYFSSLLVFTTFIWPFALSRYPTKTFSRQITVALSWPVHVFRHYYSEDAAHSRRTVLSSRESLSAGKADHRAESANR